MPRKKNAAIPQTVPATAGLGFYLREAYRAFSRDFHARLAAHGITHAQWVLLWFLSRAGSLTPLELSREAGIQKASATGVIDALKKRRLIRGDQDGLDRRKINLHLTPAGASLMKDLIACAAATNGHARAGFSDKELEALLRLLRGVTTNLENSRVSSLIDHSE
jgi:DNA-binding MarR family transcriptional regulator